MTSMNAAPLSLVIPVFNEQDNIAPLLARVHQALSEYPAPWEILLIDDGSADATVQRITEGQAAYGNHVRLVPLARNFGQTAAMQAGIDLARGDVIATLDGDLQNDPIDIPRMVNRLIAEDLDLVAGWRKNRQDNLWLRKVPSKIANRLIRKITGVTLHDYGCSLKVFRASVIKGVRLYGEMHRFIPAWLATQTAPSRIKEEVVAHHARTAGVSKYGLSRTFRVIIDLISVYFFMRFAARPAHFFGMLGLGFGALGGLTLFYLLILKLLGENIGDRPLFMVGIMLVLISVQILTTGVLSEMLSRTYHEAQDVRSYHLRPSAGEALDAPDWKQPLESSPPTEQTVS
ncbi:family 2 glycosyl transferase [Halothiobacillus diazotrophicus]|uniref:Family 2 glycosyl transferase n=1 Tax=Halothiobacillus diazotrophicus TaxID=1860122 RepID=A0A191ZEZ1_9GAMM|nr:glycosyltransferase family 2 protein [Halothiobacillus diazotrophicus]ANJ66438.1 family 2 glycosyl transferase [Halothiobacillus diazotrophicus]